ncbi:MAG TPA: glycosyltransferase family 4 protein [Candidatus Limnocylindrales bacterium]|nr:glycosyltransferase family 4 protein [Candidatus Limnocylindrales bacterium]
MKIGFVLDDTLDTADGVQQYVLTLGGWLTNQGHSVHYLVGATERTDIPNVHSLSRNMHVRFNGNRMSMPLLARRSQIRDLLEAEHFDVLHVQMPFSPLLAGRILEAAPAQTAIVGTFHIAPHSHLVTAANKALGLWLRGSLSRFRAIVSVSPAAASFARSAYGIESQVVPNVVDAERYRSAVPFEPKAGIPTILFVGRLVPRKGCAVLLEAVRLLNQRPAAPPFKVQICGKGPLEASLKQFVVSNRFEDIVEFVGFVSEADKACYMKTADLAVFPSLGGESFGIVLIEAMAAGHPVVIGADNEGYASVLGHYPELLVPVGDAEALATRLHLYLSDANARAQAVSWQRTHVQQYNVAVVGRQLEDIYKEALQRTEPVR